MMEFPILPTALLGAAFLGLCAPAEADVFGNDLRDRMRQADDFGRKARELVTGGEVEVVWPKDDGALRVVTTESDGTRMVWNIDVVNGGKRPAFDHAALVRTMAERSGKEIDGLRFEIFRIREEEPEVLWFSRGDEGWRFDMASGELEAREFDPDVLEMFSPESVMRGRRRVGERTTLLVANATDGTIEVGWVAGRDDVRGYGEIRAGETTTISTFTGEAWIARDADGKPLAGFRAGEKRSLARVTGRVDAEPRRAERRRSDRGGRGAASPDGKWRARVRNNNLCIEPVGGGEIIPLTTDGTAEAFYQGPFEWSPDSRLLACRFTRKVDVRKVHIVESSPRDQLQPKLHTLSYPKPGDELEKPMPRLFDVENRSAISVSDELFDNPWSISETAWSPNSSEFSFVYNQRGHQVMRIIGVSAEDGGARMIHEETSETFIDYSQKFFCRRLADTGEIIWASERDGRNHLYLINAATGAVKHAITSGPWNVREVVRVDEKERSLILRVFGFHEGQDPYQSHFIGVGFDGGSPVPLTVADGDHTIRFSPDGRWFLDTWSRVDQPPVTEIRRADGSLLAEVARADIAALRETGWSPPERFVAKGRDGKTDIHGVIIRPRDFDPAKRYAVVEDIYAGPHDFFVPKSFQPWFGMNRMAELGFIVVKIDGMGTNWRSKEFHDVCWKNLMDAGFPDRVAWIRAAAESRPWMDLERVGIYGGSAGGQNTLAGLLTHGDFYQAGVADCGCHDNRMDKVWWNEAWMGWPVDESYERNSNVTHAAKLKVPLMLIVGELDRNVDPASTAQVAAALQKEGIRFDYVPVMGADHGAAETPYGSFRRADFLVRHLGGPQDRTARVRPAGNGPE